MIAQFVLSPWESKRLIARAVANLPAVRKAFKEGIVAVARGTTTGMIAEELSGKFPRERYVAGCIRPRRLCVSVNTETLPEVAFFRGEMKEIPTREVVKQMSSKDVFIKGANAVDSDFNAGFLMSDPMGGTTGGAIGAIMARGINFVIPVGLEKMIPGKIYEAAKASGFTKVEYSTGQPVGLFPASGEVITEIQAIKSFADVEVVPIGAGGIEGAEGSVVLNVSGEKEEVEKVIEIVKKVLGEKPLKIPARNCKECTWATCKWTGKESSY